MNLEYTSKKKGGIISIIIVVVAVIALITYLGFDLRGTVESDLFQDNLQAVINVAKTVWEQFLKAPATWIWENALLPYVFQPLGGFIENRPGENATTTPETN